VNGERGRKVRVAIDGPAGAGKSTVARALAERLGYVLLDTGALYRTVALAAIRASIRWDDAAALGALALGLVSERRLLIERSPSGAGGPSGMRVRLDDEDVSADIRAPDVSLGASRVSAVPAVREALLDMQRSEGMHGGVVLEGRDIGTVVFPDAEVKFFLTASPEVRARRRFEELAAQGKAASYESTFADVERRDRADTERPVAPLRQAEDALVVDSSHRDVAELVEEMARVVEAREKTG
jgi:CMP/dCMP kinase